MDMVAVTNLDSGQDLRPATGRNSGADMGTGSGMRTKSFADAPLSEVMRTFINSLDLGGLGG